MWFRSDLKTSGKAAFYRNYWTVVLVSLIIIIASGGSTTGSRSNQVKTTYKNTIQNHNYSSDYYEYDDDFYNFGHSYRNGVGSAITSVIVGSVMVVVFIIILLLKILIGNNLLVGGKRFFMENREHKTPVGTILYTFKNKSYGNVLLTMFLMDLYIVLWSLLLIVPGIIKSYEYRMVPYILSENPHMDRRRAFELSRQMMNGQKMDTFILDLSFIGWGILGALTCGILNVFYVDPYVNATEAELYAVLRTHVLQTGLSHTNELPGYSIGYY